MHSTPPPGSLYWSYLNSRAIGTLLSIAGRIRFGSADLHAVPGVRVRHPRNITTAGPALLGARSELGSAREATRITVSGRLLLGTGTTIGAGCRIYVGSGATLQIGDRSYLNPQTLIHCTDGVEIGRDCAISWRVQILDNDLHDLAYDGRRSSSRGVSIGDRVWIGAGALILPGARIPSGTVVAAGAVVCRDVDEAASLVAGVPARVVRRNVSWTDHFAEVRR